MSKNNSLGQRPIGVWDHLSPILDLSIPRAGAPGPKSRGSRDTRSDIFDPWALQASIFLDFGPSFFQPRFLDGFFIDFGRILASFLHYFLAIFDASNIDLSNVILDRIFYDKQTFQTFWFWWNRAPVREKQCICIFCILFFHEKDMDCSLFFA